MAFLYAVIAIKKAMKSLKTTLFLLAAIIIWQPLFSQVDDKKDFKLTGKKPVSISVNQTFTSDSDISPIGSEFTSISGLALTAEVAFQGENGLVRISLFDENFSEYLVYETYSLLEGASNVSIDDLCEETALLEGIDPKFLRIEVKNATVTINKVSLTSDAEPLVDLTKMRKEKKAAQNDYKIKKLNKNLSEKGLLWMAGETGISELTFAERKKLYGESTIPAGFEFYTGGIFTNGQSLKSASSTSMVEQWDWRNRHGVNWVTPVKDQGSCGSCWAFAATGATEAQVNLYFNQNSINLDLSEQDVLSCSGGGTCSGGYPSTALYYIAGKGIVDESAFPYSGTNQVCTDKSPTPSQLIKIAGKMDFGSAAYPVSEDNLKLMLIKYGPVSGGLYDWSHAMTLVGWQVVKEGDRFYYRNLTRGTYWITVPSGSALIGKTVWIFKNSWGQSWGDGGYVYVETPINNFGWTHGLISPVQSLKVGYSVACVDNDGDGYYWWGLGARPASCPNTLAADGDDSDATLGPLDEFGVCTVNGAAPPAPVANFVADDTSIDQSGSVNFTDLSTNLPTSWSWSFPGGTPSTSSEKNPVVKYSVAGKYGVSLTVNNASGVPSTKDQVDYITVIYYAPSYCSSHGNATKEWISSAALNGVTYTSGSSGATGYQSIASSGFTAAANSSASLVLTPGFSAKAAAEYWAVWIDFNQDMDFNDAGELVLSAKRVKGSVSGKVTIPSTALTGNTKMRISMKRTGPPTACEVFSAGEVEDYDITILTGKAGLLAPSEEILPTVKIYPNPASQLLNLQLGEISDHARLEIFNLQGQMILAQLVSDEVTQVNVETLTAGLYIIVIYNGNSIIREKFLKD
jgi:PKD repeat protein